MPAEVSSTLNRTFAVIRPHRGRSAFAGNNKPCQSVKAAENKDVHKRIGCTMDFRVPQTCTMHVHTNPPSNYYTSTQPIGFLLRRLLFGRHSTCLQLMDLNCHIFMFLGRNQVLLLCMWVCAHLFISPDEIYRVCLPVAYSHSEQLIQSRNGLPRSKAIS